MKIQMSTTKSRGIMRGMRDAGMSYQEIGNRFGVSRGVVFYALNGRTKQQGELPDDYRCCKALNKHPELRRYLYKNGMNIKELAESCDMTPIRLRALLGKNAKWRDGEKERMKEAVGSDMFERIIQA